MWKGTCSGAKNDSGLMSVVPLDRGDRRGHFDTGFVVAVAVLSDIWRLENM
jgi:hypothetical protein